MTLPRGARALVFAIAAVTAPVWAENARASLPPANLTACTDGGDFVRATAPPTALEGSTFTVHLYADPTTYDPVDDMWVSQDAGNGWDHFASGSFTADSADQALDLTADDGAAGLEVVAVFAAAGGGQCGQDLSIPFRSTARPTKPVTVTATRSYDDAFELELHNLPASPYVCRDAPATIRVSLAGGDPPLTIRLPSGCTPDAGRRYSARHPGVWVVATLEKHLVRINIDPRRIEGTAPFRVSYTSAGVSVRWSGIYRYWVDPVRTITESNFDDYVNICINGDEFIYATGGQLACDVGGGSHSRLSLKRLP